MVELVYTSGLKKKTKTFNYYLEMVKFVAENKIKDNNFVSLTISDDFGNPVRDYYGNPVFEVKGLKDLYNKVIKICDDRLATYDDEEEVDGEFLDDDYGL